MQTDRVKVLKRGIAAGGERMKPDTIMVDEVKYVRADMVKE